MNFTRIVTLAFQFLIIYSLRAKKIDPLFSLSEAIIFQSTLKIFGSYNETKIYLQKSYEDFPKCVQDSLGITDPKVLQNEIAEAKPRGDVDEVFKKYVVSTLYFIRNVVIVRMQI